MSDGIVIDANVINTFYPEYVRGSGQVYKMISWFCVNHGIAVSEKVINEWESVCSAQVMIEWITDGIKEGKIRYVVPSLPQEVIKKIQVNYKLPKKSADLEYIKCANVTLLKYIVSEDMDLYDPKCKQESAKMKTRARDERGGALCKFLKKRLGITVGTTNHCCCDFNLT